MSKWKNIVNRKNKYQNSYLKLKIMMKEKEFIENQKNNQKLKIARRQVLILCWIIYFEYKINIQSHKMDVRLLKYDIFSSPFAHKPSKGYLPKYADRSLTSLLKYKNETIKQPIHSKIFKPYGEESETKTQQLMYTTGKLSYSSSVKNINKLPEVQLDPKAVKLLGQGRHYLRSDYQTKRRKKEQTKNNQQIKNHSSDYLMQNIQLKFCEKSVKSQFKANLIFFKKTKNIPAQIQLLKKEEEKKSMPETKNDFYDSRQRKRQMPAQKQQHTDHSMFSSTFRDNFLKSQRSNFHPKPISQEKSTRHGHKKTQSVQTQNQMEEGNKEVPLFSNNHQPNN
ncbi:unnamed protein product [Paramecium sonneborni]|uniref:Uncharacterized protein n=1 Tax=Paramecium sonneborni TaxID=65129 RepID=A0A8S1N8U5_9CILI|nr:unnamed protein product [Paramecium sonneborni]